MKSRREKLYIIRTSDGWIISYEWFNNVSPLLRLAPFILLHSHHLRQVQSCCNPFDVISAGFGGVAVLYFIPLVINIVVFSIQIHHLEPLTSTRNSLVCLAFHTFWFYHCLYFPFLSTMEVSIQYTYIVLDQPADVGGD